MSAPYDQAPQLAYQQALDLARQREPRFGEIRELTSQGIGLMPDDERLPLEAALLKARLAEMQAWVEMSDPNVDNRSRPARMRDALLVGYTAMDAAMKDRPQDGYDPHALFTRGMLANQLGHVESVLALDIFSASTAWGAYRGTREYANDARGHLEQAAKDFEELNTVPALLPLAESRARLALVLRKIGGVTNNFGALGEFDQINRAVKRHEGAVPPEYAAWIGNLVTNQKGQDLRSVAEKMGLPYGVVSAPSFEPSPYEPRIDRPAA